MVRKRIATFLGPSKGLVTAGDHAYAFNYYSVVNVQCYNVVDDSTKINWEFTLNGTKLFEYTQEGRAASIGIHMGQGNAFVIPPLTKVEVRGTTPGDVVAGAVTLTGRVYDA